MSPSDQSLLAPCVALDSPQRIMNQPRIKLLQFPLHPGLRRAHNNGLLLRRITPLGKEPASQSDTPDRKSVSEAVTVSASPSAGHSVIQSSSDTTWSRPRHSDSQSISH
ncbi:uncharacterized protein LOC123511223 [Portunus trituberculatus]|uniref:uncharacterized protein LOC123511223 n=1 Tax=Portunus trituberculatus TaxID=210409 RepID=UPI001E1CB607|nr:uncharacterized protein LOC123511223 [Portunus trituberculatus]